MASARSSAIAAGATVMAKAKAEEINGLVGVDHVTSASQTARRPSQPEHRRTLLWLPHRRRPANPSAQAATAMAAVATARAGTAGLSKARADPAKKGRVQIAKTRIARRLFAQIRIGQIRIVKAKAGPTKASLAVIAVETAARIADATAHSRASRPAPTAARASNARRPTRIRLSPSSAP